MTDKEIEQALDNLIAGGHPLSLFRDYINRLKAEIEKLKAVDNRVAFCKAYDHLQADCKRLVKEKEQIRKETATDIYKKVDEFYNSPEYDPRDAYDCNALVAYNIIREFIKRVYGVGEVK